MELSKAGQRPITSDGQHASVEPANLVKPVEAAKHVKPVERVEPANLVKPVGDTKHVKPLGGTRPGLFLSHGRPGRSAGERRGRS